MKGHSCTQGCKFTLYNRISQLYFNICRLLIFLRFVLFLIVFYTFKQVKEESLDRRFT